jgi:uncharacterized membrane protein YgcG
VCKRATSDPGKVVPKRNQRFGHLAVFCPFCFAATEHKFPHTEGDCCRKHRKPPNPSPKVVARMHPGPNPPETDLELAPSLADPTSCLIADTFRAMDPPLLGQAVATVTGDFTPTCSTRRSYNFVRTASTLGLLLSALLFIGAADIQPAEPAVELLPSREHKAPGNPPPPPTWAGLALASLWTRSGLALDSLWTRSGFALGSPRSRWTRLGLALDASPRPKPHALDSLRTHSGFTPDTLDSIWTHPGPALDSLSSPRSGPHAQNDSDSLPSSTHSGGARRGGGGGGGGGGGAGGAGGGGGGGAAQVARPRS